MLADGYYVSEKYFSDIREVILNEIKIKEESNLYKKWKEIILSSDKSVMVHARRTDHVLNKTFTLIDENYYKKAIENFDNDLEIFAFSDDAEWIKNVFPNRHVTVVSGNGLKDYEELMLMSLGKNFIIANSTYSWWSSWLSVYDNKKIIILKKWYRSMFWWRANRDVEFSGWVRI